MEFDVVEGADSSLGDDAGPDGRSRDAVQRIARHVDETFLETDRKNKEKFAESTTTEKNRHMLPIPGTSLEFFLLSTPDKCT